MKQYLELLQDVIDNGTRKGDRTGTGTTAVFGRQFRHNLADGFQLLNDGGERSRFRHSHNMTRDSRELKP